MTMKRPPASVLTSAAALAIPVSVTILYVFRWPLVRLIVALSDVHPAAVDGVLLGLRWVLS